MATIGICSCSRRGICWRSSMNVAKVRYRWSMCMIVKGLLACGAVPIGWVGRGDGTVRSGPGGDGDVPGCVVSCSPARRGRHHRQERGQRDLNQRYPRYETRAICGGGTFGLAGWPVGLCAIWQWSPEKIKGPPKHENGPFSCSNYGIRTRNHSRSDRPPTCW